MKQLLPKEFIREVEFTEVIIIKIPSKIIEDLFGYFKQNEKLFFPDCLSHLKRMNKSPIQDKILEKDEAFALICLKEVYCFQKSVKILKSEGFRVTPGKYPYKI